MNAKRPTRGEAAVPEDAASVAERLKRQAQGSGATGRHVTLAQRRLRDTAILTAAQTGQKISDIADAFEITTRQVRRIVHEHRAQPSALDAKSMELVEELLSMYRRAIADFEAMADYYRDSHPNVTLGAKRGAIETRERLQILLETIGKLPTNVEVFRSEAEVERLGLAMLAALEQAKQGEITATDAHERIRRLLESGPPQADFDVDAFSETMDEEAGDG